jgi:hypothetical protein
MTLRTGCQGDPPLVHGRIRIDLCLDSVNAVAGRTGGRIASPPRRKGSVDTVDKLLCNVRMANAASLGDVGAKNRRLRVNQGPQTVTPVTTDATHSSRHLMDASLEEFSGAGSYSQGMLLYKLFIGMAPAAGLRNIGKMSPGFGIFAWQDIVLPVAILAISGSFRALHDHLRVKAFFIFLFSLRMTARAVYPLIRSLSSARGMGVIPNLGMAIGAGKAPVDRVFIICFRYKKGDLLSTGILCGQGFILMTAQTV